MTADFTRQLGVALKIWLLAICFNTIAGTIYLTHFLRYTDMIPFIIVYGIILGAAFSFPIFLLLAFVINRCVAKKIKGPIVWRIVLLTGIISTLITWAIFQQWFGGLGSDKFVLMSMALLAAVFSISLQHKSIYRLVHHEDEAENFLIKPTTNK